MSVLTAYQQLLSSNKIKPDAAQLNAVESLETLSLNLIENNNSANRLRSSFWYKKKYINGIYFHGRVGRGKTMLMDLFFQHLAFENKIRIHFHRFMADVHLELKNLAGIENPLECIAHKWSKNTKLLCFDEFFVSDIGDAMLLSRLFQALFHHGIILVATSNCHPDDLYRNGLQREKFLPTIRLIKTYCQIVSVNGDQDHRIPDELDITWMKNYTVASNDGINTSEFGQRLFKQLSNALATDATITVNCREIRCRGMHNGIIWFDFTHLCSSPRSQNDYIIIADRYHCVIVTDVMQFTGETLNNATKGIEEGYIADKGSHQQIARLDDEARRFIALVDELYDRKVRLVIHASVAINELYLGELLSFEFARCQSRIIEMQSW